MSTATPLTEYDLLSQEFQAHNYEFYERAQDECPVFRMPETNIYIITRQDDVKQVAGDYETFSNNIPLAPLQEGRWHVYEEIVERDGWTFDQALNSADPPDHRRSRRYLDSVLKKSVVRDMKPRIQDVVDMLIDRFIDQGECDFVTDFAIPFPSIVISEQLGFGADNIDKFTRWALNLTLPTNTVLSEDELRECATTTVEMQHFLEDLMEQRRQEPKDDFLTRIVQENNPEIVDDVPLSTAEVHTVLRFVIAGAFGTVINMLGNALYLLLRHPDQLAKLRAEPDRIPAFIEEALRIETPVQMLPRIATRDVELHGTLIPKGAVVMLHFGAANHDRTKFECPHEFDIERENAGDHVTFNTGPHFCPGRLLARQELQIAFETLLRRLDNIELGEGVEHPPHIASWRHRMITSLPIKFKKA